MTTPLGSTDPSPGPIAGAAESPSPASISLQVNGEQRTCPAGLSLDQVLESLGYRPQLVVVEFNGEILARGRWSSQMVQEGDGLEVVTIVGGG